MTPLLLYAVISTNIMRGLDWLIGGRLRYRRLYLKSGLAGRWADLSIGIERLSRLQPVLSEDFV
jgi:hypothetical protein